MNTRKQSVWHPFFCVNKFSVKCIWKYFDILENGIKIHISEKSNQMKLNQIYAVIKKKNNVINP